MNGCEMGESNCIYKYSDESLECDTYDVTITNKMNDNDTWK